MENDKARILLVDADSEFRKEIGNLLERYGYIVSGMSTGAEALRFLMRDSCDLVISEVRLPDISGMELMMRIQSIGRRTEMIFLTNDDDWKSYVDLMNMGAFEYVKKSSGNDEIIRVVDQAMKGTLEPVSLHQLQ